MSELKQLEQWFDIVKHLAEDTGGPLNNEAIIMYIYSYYKQTLSQLLEKEYPDAEKEDGEDKIFSLLTLASAKTCKDLAEELSSKYVPINVNKINTILSKTKLSEEELIANSNHIVQAFCDTETMIEKLTYKEHPLDAFNRFIDRNNIKIRPGNGKAYNFAFIFKGEPFQKDGRYECNTICEFLNYCSVHILDKLCEKQLIDIRNNTGVIKTTPQESFDYNIAKDLKNHELYQYLDSFEYIRLNFFLEDLYLLLYYEEITDFSNPTVMEGMRAELTKQRLWN